MRIRVTAKEGRVVEFECAAGRGRGTWASQSLEASVGAEAHIELSLDEEAVLEPLATTEPPSLRTDGEVTVLTLTVEDPEGVLRLAPDALVLHHLEVPLAANVKVVRVRQSPRELALWPYTL